VSEPSHMKQNLVDPACELLKHFTCATTECYTILVLDSSSGSSSDVVKWSSRETLATKTQ